MHVCKGANLASSSSWMCIAYISLSWFALFYPFVDDWQKGGEWFWVYICIFEFLHILSLCILQKEGEWFGMFKQKGGEGFWEKDFGCLHVSLTLLMHIYLFCFMYFIENLIIYCYAWVKGELLWSLTLIHAYITSWVLSSSKMGRLLAQRHITLVLIMINSCSYCTNDLVFN